MPRIRSIKPSFFRSEDVSALPFRARLTWIGLWTHCDDAGRAKDNARLIKGDIWPLDNVSLRDIEEDLQILAGHGRIVRYEVDGKRYLEIVNWAAHQAISKPSPSRLPSPSAGRILTFEEPPEEPDDDPEPEPSDTSPGNLPEDSRKAPAWKGRERKGREGRGGDARVRERANDPGPTDLDSKPPTPNLEMINPDEPPPMRCADHIRTLGEIPPCRGCANAKETRREWEAARVMAIAHAQSTEARQRAEANRAAIDACGMCDDRGYLDDRLCSHDAGLDDRTRRGAAAARAIVGARPRLQTSHRPADETAEASARIAARRDAHQAWLTSGETS